ncbi:MAG TPA: TolC family protein [Thermoanaerobaculia bacterium]|nr:TolC family protein [Thermoanaerobaculia bacterium]
MYRNRTAAQFFLLGSILALRLYAAEPAASPGIGVAEAIRMMLDQDPNLTIEESRLRSSRGILLSTRGAFDPVVSTSLSEREVEDPLSESTSRQQSILTNRLGVTKRYRTGFSIEPDLQLTRTAGSDPGAVNLGTVALTLRQPLLRGRGRAATAAPELSAERQVAASELDLRQTTSERALTVIAQYWQARAGLLNLEILEESEARARDLLETTRKLIEADVTPAADLVQVEANVVAKETARIGGERDLFEARQALGREIGLPPESIATLPVPVDRFPIVSASAVPSTADHSRWVARALEGRADLMAARERRSAAELLRKAAENALKPQLDLVFTPSYTGLVQGSGAGTFFSPLYSNVPGAGSALSLSLSWPTLNSRARGDLAQFEAALEQSAHFEELLSRQIGANVPIALDAVARNAQQFERATEAVRLFERVVENEEKKLRAGTSTLIDVISQRDRLTAARQSQVSAHLALAVSLAQLRFETGTLLPGGDARAIDTAQLTTIPFQAGDEP